MRAAARVWGMDFGAVLAFGAARQCNTALLAAVLPSVEGALVAAYQPDE